MRVDIVTIFPEAFAPLDLSILGRARERGLLEIVVWDLREFTTDRHRQVDDSPYGGGAGMVMKPEPFLAAVDAIRAAAPATSPRIILTSPQGERLTHALARRLHRTLVRRPDLLRVEGLSAEDRRLLQEFGLDIEP